MIRFFFSYFLALLIVGVCWHLLLNEWDFRIRQRRIWRNVERRIRAERIK